MNGENPSARPGQPQAGFAPGPRPVSFRRRRERDRAVLRALLGGDLRPGDARRLPRPADESPDWDGEPPPQQLRMPLPPGPDVPDGGFCPRAPHSARAWGAHAPTCPMPFH